MTGSVLTVALAALVVKLFGFVEKLLLAGVAGTGASADIFFVVMSLPMLVFLLVREIIEPCFLPVFVDHLKGGREERSWRLLRGLGLAVVALLLVGVALVCWHAEAVVGWMAWGMRDDPEAVRTAAGLLRVTVPAGALLALSTLSHITLHSYRRFGAPALGEILQRIGPVAGALLFGHTHGVAAFAIGFAGGVSARFVVHLVALRQHLGMLWRRLAPEPQDLRRMGLLALPLVLGSAFAQLSEIADTSLASLVGEGGISAKSFARRLRDLPLEVGAYSLGVVLFPYFAHHAAEGQGQRHRELLVRSAHGLTIAFAWVSVVVVLLSEPIVSLVYERGAFDEISRLRTAGPLVMYGLGMVAFALDVVLVNYFFALEDPWVPVLLGVAGTALNVALCFALVGPLGVEGIALALTLSKSAKICGLALFLRRHALRTRVGPVVLSAGRILGAAALSAAAVMGGSRWLAEPLFVGPPTLQRAGALAAVIAASGGVFVAGLWLSRPEREVVRETARRVAAFAMRRR